MDDVLAASACQLLRQQFSPSHEPDKGEALGAAYQVQECNAHEIRGSLILAIDHLKVGLLTLQNVVESPKESRF